jgi:hypothetical protein
MTLILSGTNGLSDVDGDASTPAIRGTDGNTGIFFGSDVIGFSEGGTECGRFNSSGNLQTIGTISVGNATPSTSGAGITFPATQSASSNANTLDDYEEGTFTPSMSFQTPGTSSFTFSDALGRYTKIGRMVFVEVLLRLSSFSKGTASGNPLVTNLPFTVVNAEPIALGNIGFFNTPFSEFPVAAFEPNTTTIRLLVSLNNTGWISQSDPDSDSQYIFSGTYIAA